MGEKAKPRKQTRSQTLIVRFWHEDSTDPTGKPKVRGAILDLDGTPLSKFDSSASAAKLLRKFMEADG